MKVGIIGYGLMGKRRVQHLDPDDELVAVRDPAFADSYGDLDACDALIIAAPTQKLVEVAKLHGHKKLLIEKPCATSAAEWRTLVDGRDGVNITPGYTLRAYPGMRAAKHALTAANLGHVLFAKMTYGHGGLAEGWRATSGELLDQGSHLLDLAEYFFGPMRITRAQFLHAASPLPAAEDNVFLSCTSARGLGWCPHVELHASWTLWQPTFSVEIFCENGLVRVTGLGTQTYGLHKLEVRSRRYPVSETTYPHAFEHAHRTEWQDFKAGVSGDLGWQRAYAVLQLIDDARAMALSPDPR